MQRSRAMIPFLFHLSSQATAFRPSDQAHQVPPTREDVLSWMRWVHKRWFPDISISRLEGVVDDVMDLFEGRFPGYRKCDTRYHDLEHTLRLISPFCQIAGGLASEHHAILSSIEMELGLVAVLLHDAGYIRRDDDRVGTGAKYTFRHIDRSVAFARRYLPTVGYDASDLDRVEEMIRCTGVKAELEQVDFQTDGTQLMGYALGTSDLLAQMADPLYMEKLPLLFREFQEAYAYEGEEQLQVWGVQPMQSAGELIQKTPLFYDYVVRRRLEGMGALHRFLEDPATGRNPFLETINDHLEAISRIERR
jgi:hypothetical protein